MLDFIIDMLRSPDAQADDYTWGAALLGHFAIGLILTAAIGAASYLADRYADVPRLTAWQSALIVSAGYAALWEGVQIIWFGGGIADSLVDAAAVACGAVVAAGAWRNKGAAVVASLGLLAMIGVAGVRKRR